MSNQRGVIRTALVPFTVAAVAAGIMAVGCTVNMPGAGNTAGNNSNAGQPAANTSAIKAEANQPTSENVTKVPAPKKGSGSERSVRISFAKGETSAMSTETIAASSIVNFVLNAQKGQKLEFTVGYDFADSDLSVFLAEPGGDDFVIATGPKKREEYVLEKSGDHTIVVSNTSGRSATITLYVDITN